jgi:hypothetical protein
VARRRLRELTAAQRAASIVVVSMGAGCSVAATVQPRRPGADVLYTSCADGPGSPRGFYLRYGFTDTGRIMWGENVLALDLAV